MCGFAPTGPKELSFFLNPYLIGVHKNVFRAILNTPVRRHADMLHVTTWKKIVSFTSKGFAPAKLQLKYILHK